jgi:hypothetical protein
LILAAQDSTLPGGEPETGDEQTSKKKTHPQNTRHVPHKP